MNNDRPKILIFIDWFAPGFKAGGPVASCINFIHLMKDDYSLYVFTSDTDLGEKTPYKDIVVGKWTSSPNYDCMIYYADSNKSIQGQIREVVDFVNPDFVYLNHMFSPKFVVYPLWLKWKNFIRCKVVIAPRGALYESALAIKSYKKIPFIKLFRWVEINKKVRFHATNTREEQAILKYFPGSEVKIADDLPNTKQPSFFCVEKKKGIIKCIFIARIHPIKNLSFLLSAISHVKQQVCLTIIGPIEDPLYWDKCKVQINSLPQNIQVNYEGALPNNALMPILQNHHLFILPTKGENFGHSIFESFLAGRPVLISDQTPWLQLKANHVGWDISLDNQDDFTTAIEIAASWDQAIFEDWSRSSWNYAKKFIENPVLKQQYLQIFS